MLSIKLPASGILWMVISLLSFMGMAISSRELAGYMSIFQILFFRSFVGLVIMLPIILRERARLVAAADIGLQVIRNVVHFSGQYLWTVGIASLPLVKVFALEFTTPLWVSVLAFLILKEKISMVRAAASLGGFVGVLVVLRPGFDAVEPATFVVLLAAIGYAASIVMVKKLTLTSSPSVIVIWMVLLQLPLGFVFSINEWRAPDVGSVPWIVCLGVTGLSAHYAMAKALTLMDASVAIPIDFFRVPLIAVVGYFLYEESMRIWVLVGALIIFCSNYIAFRFERKF